MKKITFFSAGRSDYGIMRNIILAANKDKKIRSSLIITGSHLSKIFGKTINEISKDKIKNIYKIKLNYILNKNDQTNIQISYLIKETEKILKKIEPDYVIVLGDRYEMFAMSIAAFNNNIKIIHFCGGSETLGAKDDQYRKCISILASYHFVETSFHKKKLIDNGIKKNSIFLSGAPALENLAKIKFLNKKKLFENFNIKEPLGSKTIVATFHPETKISLRNNIKNLEILFKFLANLKDAIIIFTYPNADYGYNEIIKIIDKVKKKNFYKFKSLGIKNYFNFLKIADMLIGNSSSGIIESKSFNLPVINLGNRQKGRFQNLNVMNCIFDLNLIKKKYLSINRKKFKEYFLTKKNIYELKISSKKIIKIINNNFNF